MKVNIKSLHVQMDIKNKGIELEIRTPRDEHLGDIIVSKSGLIWCQGRARREGGARKSWEQIIAFMNQQ